MKKALALMLAVAVFLGCAGVHAENLQVKIHFDFDPESMQDFYMTESALMLPDESLVQPMWQAIESIAGLMGVMDIELKADENNTYFALNLKEKAVVDFCVSIEADDTSRMESSLIPGYYFLTTAQENAQESRQAEEMNQWLADMLSLYEEIVNDVGQTISDSLQPETVQTEAGEYRFGTSVFTSKTQIEVDVQKVWQVFDQYVPRLYALLEQGMVLMGYEPDEQAMLDAIEQARNAPMPEYLQGMRLVIEEYTTEDGQAMARICRGIWEENQVSLKLWEELGGANICLYYDEMVPDNEGEPRMETAIGVELVVRPTEKGFEADMEAEVYGAFNLYHLSLEKLEGEYFKLVYQTFSEEGGRPMCTITLSALPYEGEVPAVDTEGKESLPISTLEADPYEGNDDYTKVENALGMGMNNLLIQAILAAPAEIQNVMNAITGYENALLEYYFSEWEWEEPTEMIPEEGIVF